MPRQRMQAVGRHDIARVPDAPGGFASDIPFSLHNSRATITPVAVVDVFDARRRHRALARIDLLDKERRAGRLNEAEFLMGREVEAVFERMGHVGGGGQWFEGDRIDAAAAAELATVLGIERAAVVNAFLGWLVRHIGRLDTHLLWEILGERRTFAQAAAMSGRPGTRGVHTTIDRFRDALAVLALVKAARGQARRS